MRAYLRLHLSSIMFGAHTNSATMVAWLLARLTENDGIMVRLCYAYEDVCIVNEGDYL